MEPVARELLGEPNARLSSKHELRFGSNGSLSVDLVKGVWRDHEAGKGGGVLDLIRDRLRIDKAGALRWLRERGHLAEAGAQEPRRPVAWYDYASETGELLFQVVRFEPKDFRQRAPDGRGGWSWKIGAVRRVAFRLPEILAAVSAGQTVFFAEGEKAALRLAGIGLAATCSPGGAGKWRPDYGAPLRKAAVVILPDNDAAGLKHARQVAAALAPVAASVRVLELPGLPAKGDPFDWIEAGGTAAELHALAAEAPIAADWLRGLGEVADPEPSAGGAGGDPWQGRLQCDERGQVIPNLANAALGLRQSPELAGICA